MSSVVRYRHPLIIKTTIFGYDKQVIFKIYTAIAYKLRVPYSDISFFFFLLPLLSINLFAFPSNFLSFELQNQKLDSVAMQRFIAARSVCASIFTRKRHFSTTLLFHDNQIQVSLSLNI